MTGFAIFVIISLILLGIGAILAIGSAASENKALKITAAVWVSIATIATIISVVIYHKAAKWFVESSAFFTYSIMDTLRNRNYNPDFLIQNLEREIPELYRGRQYLPYHETFVDLIKDPTVELILGKKRGDAYANRVQVAQVWNKIVDEAALEDAKDEIAEKVAKKAAKRSKE